MKKLHSVSFILVIIGGLNWLLIGLFNWNLVEAIFGTSWIAKLIYILVGLSAIVEIAGHKSMCKACDKGMASGAPKPQM